MIFVDTNVFMYAVGREHPLRETARQFFINTKKERTSLCTSAEVLQELLHAYIPVGRIATPTCLRWLRRAAVLPTIANLSPWPKRLTLS